MRTAWIVGVCLLVLAKPLPADELDDLRQQVEELKRQVENEKRRVEELRRQVDLGNKRISELESENARLSQQVNEGEKKSARVPVKVEVLRGFESVVRAIPSDVVPAKPQRDKADFSQLHLDRIRESLGPLTKDQPRIELMGEIAALPSKVKNLRFGETHIEEGYIIKLHPQGEPVIRLLGLPWQFEAEVVLSLPQADKLETVGLDDIVRVEGRIGDVRVQQSSAVTGNSVSPGSSVLRLELSVFDAEPRIVKRKPKSPK